MGVEATVAVGSTEEVMRREVMYVLKNLHSTSVKLASELGKIL